MPGSHSKPNLPPPPPGKRTKRGEIPIDDSDIIDVIVGEDEEKAHAAKRRHEHEGPDVPGIPPTVAPEQNVPEIEDEDDEDLRRARHLDGGVEKELGTADTERRNRGVER